MGIGFKKTATIGDIPVWQGVPRNFLNAQGGFLLDITGLVAGSILKAGTPMGFDELTRVAKAFRTAMIQAVAGGAATDYQVFKGHTLKVGDNFAAFGTGGKAYPITAINTSNADYDVITVGTTIGAAAVGDVMYASSATGATSSAYSFEPKGLLYAEAKAEAGESVSVALEGVVYARRIPAYSAALAAKLKANGCDVHFSQSY